MYTDRCHRRIAEGTFTLTHLAIFLIGSQVLCQKGKAAHSEDPATATFSCLAGKTAKTLRGNLTST